MHLGPASALLYSLLALESASAAHAIHLRINGRPNNQLQTRGNLNGSSPLSNSVDISYYSEITLGGQAYTVLIDTGSSDLWVAGSVPGAKDSGKDSGVNYAVGGAQGDVKTADLEFAGFTVKDQAFIEVKPDADHKEGEGLIGLGPVQGSNIYDEFDDDRSAAAVLDRIFMQNTTTPNYLTVLLGRTDDPTDIFAGDLTVGVLVDGYGDVMNQPKIDVAAVPVREDGDQHFQFLMDEGGILGPDGQAIEVQTIVDETKNKKQLTAVVDTGFSLSQVPKKVATAVYSRFVGSQYMNVTGIGEVWVVPCDQEVNMTFVIQGKRYPIHPLDTSMKPSTLGMADLVADGIQYCIGLFQPVSFDLGDSPNYDMILGMSFLRNVYSLYNFGDFVADKKNSRGKPYMQMLSTTDSANAHADFVSVRLDGDDRTDLQTLLPVSDDGDADGADKPAAKHDSDTSTRNIILGLSIGGVVIALSMLAAIFFHCRRSRKRAAFGFVPGGGKYVPLGEGHAPAAMAFSAPQQDTSYHGTAASFYPPPPVYAQQQEPLYDPHSGAQSGGIQSQPMYDPYTPNIQPPLRHEITRS